MPNTGGILPCVITISLCLNLPRLPARGVTRLQGAGDPLQTEQKYPVLLEYAKASFERIKQRLRHL
jgi:hypothetical protein